MIIRMSITAPGSVDGIRVSTFEMGAEYDLTATAGERELASSFVSAGMAVEVGAECDPVAATAVVEQAEPSGTVDAAAPGKPGRKTKK